MVICERSWKVGGKCKEKRCSHVIPHSPVNLPKVPNAKYTCATKRIECIFKGSLAMCIGFVNVVAEGDENEWILV